MPARMDFNHGRVAAVAIIALTGLLAAPLAQAPPQQNQQQQQQNQQQQRPAQQPPAQPPAAPPPAPGTPPKPLVPLAASTVADNPDPYYGEYVTVTAAVDQILSRTSFSVDQDATKSTGKDVLVIAPTMNGKVDPNAYVTVIGELVKFDAAEIAKKAKNYTLDLPADAAAKYQGRPTVIATAVINSAFVDVAKRLPPPLTAEEETYQKVMKKVGPAFAALRTAVDGSNAEKTTENTAVLKQAFAETEAFWKSRGRADAAKWAQDARANVETIDKAAPAAKWDDAKAATGTLGQACQTCHTAYRERFDDGSFRIKMPGK
jgi:cytochrome c556